MLNTELHLNPSPYSGLYDILVPADHIIRGIDAFVDFSFVMDEVRDKYSGSIGRMGMSLVVLFKYLLLKDNYGYRNAYSSGIQAMRIQVAFAIFAANLHRIMVLTDGKQQSGAE